MEGDLLEFAITWVLDPKMWGLGFGFASLEDDPVPAKAWGFQLGFIQLQVTLFNTFAAEV